MLVIRYELAKVAGANTKQQVGLTAHDQALKHNQAGMVCALAQLPEYMAGYMQEVMR